MRSEYFGCCEPSRGGGKRITCKLASTDDNVLSQANGFARNGKCPKSVKLVPCVHLEGFVIQAPCNHDVYNYIWLRLTWYCPHAQLEADAASLLSPCACAMQHTMAEYITELKTGICSDHDQAAI